MVCLNVSGKKLLYRSPASGHTFSSFFYFVSQYDENDFAWSCSTSLNVFKVKGPQMALPQILPLDILMFKLMLESLRFV